MWVKGNGLDSKVKFETMQAGGDVVGNGANERRSDSDKKVQS